MLVKKRVVAFFRGELGGGGESVPAESFLRGSSIYILAIFSKRMKIVSDIFTTLIKISIERFRHSMRKSRLLVITLLHTIYKFYDMM